MLDGVKMFLAGIKLARDATWHSCVLFHLLRLTNDHKRSPNTECNFQKISGSDMNMQSQASKTPLCGHFLYQTKQKDVLSFFVTLDAFVLWYALYFSLSLWQKSFFSICTYVEHSAYCDAEMHSTQLSCLLRWIICYLWQECEVQHISELKTEYIKLNITNFHWDLSQHGQKSKDTEKQWVMLWATGNSKNTGSLLKSIVLEWMEANKQTP